MVLEKEAPTVETAKTEDLTRVGQNSDNPQKKACNRKSQISTVSKHPVYGCKEGFRRGQVNSRSLKSKQEYRLSTLQNVDDERSKAFTTQGLLDSVHRPKGWILAPRGVKKQTSIPRFSLQGSRLAIQSHAIWSERSPSNLYKSSRSRGKGNGKRRDLLSTISRRSSHCCFYMRTLFPSCKPSSLYPQVQ